MRIIAGALGGRSFDSPRSHRTHPMSDRVRGALFNTLGDIRGLTVLDAFAGSGALAFEALSRGASSALLIESDRPAQTTLERNIETLELQDRATLVKANCSSWSRHNPKDYFDLVLLDPPYDHIQWDALDKMMTHPKKPNGLVVLSWPGKFETPKFNGLAVVDQKRYGDAQLIFYR